MLEYTRLKGKKEIVTPAKAGVQGNAEHWIPVFTGMTRKTKICVHMLSSPSSSLFAVQASAVV